jgi:hypothetical protein
MPKNTRSPSNSSSSTANSPGTGHRPLHVKLGRAAAAAAALAGVCPICRVRRGDVEMGFGPMYTRVCTTCADPIWHAMGLYDWAKKLVSFSKGKG